MLLLVRVFWPLTERAGLGRKPNRYGYPAEDGNPLSRTTQKTNLTRALFIPLSRTTQNP